MKHFRSMEIDTTDYQVGDIISFTLKDGEQVEAMAVKQEADGMIFCAVDCLADECAMKHSGNYSDGYKESDLRKSLKKTINRFPDDLRELLVPFDNGDPLRIPTEKEIFGVNERGEAEPEEVTQFEPMKLRRNRIAFQGHNGAWEWCWLQNRSVHSASNACFVNSSGYASYTGASNSHGVRPLFKIKNH